MYRVAWLLVEARRAPLFRSEVSLSILIEIHQHHDGLVHGQQAYPWTMIILPQDVYF
jgi:hypothetical protein